MSRALKVPSMKRFTFVLLLLLCTSAWADWTAVGVGDQFNTYADLATIRKQGNTVTMWSLFDFRTSQAGVGYEFLSQKAQDEYDCDGQRSRTLSFSSHSGNMAAARLFTPTQTLNDGFRPHRGARTGFF